LKHVDTPRDAHVDRAEPAARCDAVENPWDPDRGAETRLYRGLTKKALDVDGMPTVVDTPIGPFVRVQNGKDSKYRETPVPTGFAAPMRALADMRDEAADTPLVDRSPRTIRRWITTAGERLSADTGDDGWTYLGPHDLRRTWGTLLVEREVAPGLVMGGVGGRTGRRFGSTTSGRPASTRNSAGSKRSIGVSTSRHRHQASRSPRRCP
jgi:hypothetical protein